MGKWESADQSASIEKVTNADGTCSFQPPPNTPEAPVVLLLPVSGLAVFGGVYAYRRRAARHTIAS